MRIINAIGFVALGFAIAALVLPTCAHAYNADPNIAATEPCLTLKAADAIVAQQKCAADDHENAYFHICQGQKAQGFEAKDGKTVVQGPVCAPHLMLRHALRYKDLLYAFGGFAFGMLFMPFMDLLLRVKIEPRAVRD